LKKKKKERERIISGHTQIYNRLKCHIVIGAPNFFSSKYLC